MSEPEAALETMKSGSCPNNPAAEFSYGISFRTLINAHHNNSCNLELLLRQIRRQYSLLTQKKDQKNVYKLRRIVQLLCSKNTCVK